MAGGYDALGGINSVASVYGTLYHFPSGTE
jgi:hypothetical protein